MQSGFFLEIIIILLLIIINGVFASSEIAMVSASKTRLKKLALGGNKKAEAALNLAKSPNKFLSTVQIGITLVGIFAGAYGGATLSGKLAEQFAGVEFFAPYSSTLGFLVVVICITYLSLVIGELVPKRLAMNNPEALALIAVKPMNFISIVAKPFIWLLSISTELVLKILGYKPSNTSSISEEEIKILVDEGTQSGVIDEAEKSIIYRVLKAGDLDVSKIMTIRQEMKFIDKDKDPDLIEKMIFENTYSRYPVFEKNFDNIIGIVNTKDILKDIAKNGNFEISRYIIPVVKVREKTPVLHLLEILKEKETYIAIVTNESDGTEGLVTLRDIMNSIVGDTEKDEKDEVIKINDNEYLLSGSLPIEDFKELLNVSILPNEELEYNTLAGFVMTNLEAVPKEDDEFEWRRYKIKVIEMKGMRIMKVKLTMI